MPLMSQPSSAAKTSLAYITAGALLLVWTGIWYWYLRDHAVNVLPSTWYFCYGLLATGAVLLGIGLAVGQIGRQARHAELPPPEIKKEEAMIEQTAAARPVIVPQGAAPAGAQPGTQPVAVPAAPAPAVPLNQPVAPAPRV